MATRKVKRFDDGGSTDTEFGDLEGAMDAANARAVQEQFDANEKASAAPKATPKASAPKAESKPAAAPSKPAASSSQGSGVTRMSKEAGEAAQAKFRESSKPAAAAPKKEMYRTFGGKMAEKAPDTSAADAAARREKISSAVSAVGNYLKSLGQREQKHGTYVKDGKVVRYASGGSTASKRADGIASRGKTRGKIC